tara:strand:+ start:261 stop:362 length:102 start_codon:yes stop_codon:yes gene_type:complete
MVGLETAEKAEVEELEMAQTLIVLLEVVVLEKT